MASYSRLSSPPFRFNVLRFVVWVEQLIEYKQHLFGVMGALYSSFKSKQRRKKAMKSYVKREVEIAREYCRALQEEVESAERHLDKLLRYSPSICSSLSTSSESDCSTVSTSLSYTSNLETALLTDSGVSLVDDHESLLTSSCCACAVDENLRLLDQCKEDIEEDLRDNASNLDALQLKMESYRFRHFVAVNPVENWSVCSVPPYQ